MSKEISDRLKTIQLNMFKVFITICNNNNLQYFLVGGTALGAIRHKGFIPWDDDIDVAMPREDYEKFITIAQKQLPENLFLQNCFTDEEYIMNFSKIRNSDTTFIETSVKNFNINHGVYIDVFPLDGVTTKFIARIFFNIKNCLLSLRTYNKFYFEKNTLKVKIKKTIALLANIVYPNIRKAVLKREKLLQKTKYNDNIFISNYCGAWKNKETVPKEWFGEGVLGSFEDIDVILPTEYDKYLSQMYGNYMTPPPIEQQVGHHYCTVIDLENSYRKYIGQNNK